MAIDRSGVSAGTSATTRTPSICVLHQPESGSEPAGNGPDDGIFNLKLAEFQKLYQTLMYTE